MESIVKLFWDTVSDEPLESVGKSLEERIFDSIMSTFFSVANSSCGEGEKKRSFCVTKDIIDLYYCALI